jgi:hypothetical protein
MSDYFKCYEKAELLEDFHFGNFHVPSGTNVVIREVGTRKRLWGLWNYTYAIIEVPGIGMLTTRLRKVWKKEQ